MSSGHNPSYQQLGVGIEAINSSFVGMAEAPPPFLPANDAAGFGLFGEFMASSMAMVAAGDELACAVPLQMESSGSRRHHWASLSEDIAAAESCSTVHSMLPAAAHDSPGEFEFRYGTSCGVTIAQASSMGKLAGEPQLSWVYGAAPGIAPFHEPWFSGAGVGDPFAASSAPASELSLRLGAKTEAVSIANQSSEVTCSGLTHASSRGFGAQYHPLHVGAGAGGEMRSRPPHFSQVVSSRSGLAHIAQELLNGFVGCVLQDVDAVSGTGSEASSDQMLAFPPEEHSHAGERSDLVKLLQLMDQKCNQCLGEMQSTASKFSGMVRPGGVVGCGGGLFAPFARRAVAVAYGRLRSRIMGHIMAQQRSPPPPSLAEKERRLESSFIQKHWALQQLRRGDQQSWRPQRGLPEKSVAVLKAWMFENFLRPYPKDNEKDMLAARSGLSRSQVSNWFINARVRLWKPMIEDMYEELKKSSGGSSDGAETENIMSIKNVIS